MAENPDLEARVAALETEVRQLSARVRGRGRLDATAAGQQQIADMLTTLIARQDEPPTSAR